MGQKITTQIFRTFLLDCWNFG